MMSAINFLVVAKYEGKNEKFSGELKIVINFDRKIDSSTHKIVISSL